MNKERLSSLDSSFLHLEAAESHMHVAACAIFDGPAPTYEELLCTIESRLHLVPRYRQRLAFVPLGQGRPVWVDDPQFRLPFHVRHTALPKPGSEAQLRRLAGRVFSQTLDRSRPLWELWMVEGLIGGRYALLTKTHQALVDGVFGLDLTSVLFDTCTDPAPVPPPTSPWIARPLPTDTQLLAEALRERVITPGESARSIKHLLRTPNKLLSRVGGLAIDAGLLSWAGIESAPKSPYNVPIGPHRRFAWLRAELDDFKAIKNQLGGTVNDVVLTVVAGALGEHMRQHEHDTEDLVLRALVPVSVRADADEDEVRHELAAMWAPLPVGIEDPVERFQMVAMATAGVKDSRAALGAEMIADMSGFAPPTLVAQAARLQARQRLFNLVVTNVPGPQHTLYCMGSRLDVIYPMVPLAENTTVGIAVMSYDGALNFGLNADYDAVSDLEELATQIRVAIAQLRDAAAEVATLHF